MTTELVPTAHLTTPEGEPKQPSLQQIYEQLLRQFRADETKNLSMEFPTPLSPDQPELKQELVVFSKGKGALPDVGLRLSTSSEQVVYKLVFFKGISKIFGPGLIAESTHEKRDPNRSRSMPGEMVTPDLSYRLDPDICQAVASVFQQTITHAPTVDVTDPQTRDLFLNRGYVRRIGTQMMEKQYTPKLSALTKEISK